MGIAFLIFKADIMNVTRSASDIIEDKLTNYFATCLRLLLSLSLFSIG